MKPLVSAATLAVAMLCASAPASAAIVLTFTPSTSHINIGGSVVIDVSISGLGAEILSAVDLNFLFTGVAAGKSARDFSGLNTALGAPDADVFFDTETATEVGIQAYSFFPDTLAAVQANTFSLGTFTFDGMFDGVTTLSLGADPDFQRNFAGLNALALDVVVGSACIAVGSGVCTVPEPASYGLAAVALLAAGTVGRTRRRLRHMA